VIDISSPLSGTHRGLAISGNTIAAEEPASLIPASYVVKAFNTTFASTLVEGQVAGQPLGVRVAAADAHAKRVIVDLANGRPEGDCCRAARTSSPTRSPPLARHQPPRLSRSQLRQRLDIPRLSGACELAIGPAVGGSRWRRVRWLWPHVDGLGCRNDHDRGALLRRLSIVAACVGRVGCSAGRDRHPCGRPLAQHRSAYTTRAPGLRRIPDSPH
jgi:hypothetical protein